MSTYGITALDCESSYKIAGLFGDWIPKNGKVTLKSFIDRWEDDDNIAALFRGAYPEPIVFAELIIKYNINHFDYFNHFDKRWSKIKSFIANKKSIKWLRDFISETLVQTVVESEYDTICGYGVEKWGGLWTQESEWIAWQKHMVNLVDYFDKIITSNIRDFCGSFHPTGIFPLNLKKPSKN